MRTRLILLGLIYYALTQGSMFVSLACSPAVTVNLILFTSIHLGLFAVPVLGLVLAAAGTYLVQRWSGATKNNTLSRPAT